MLKPMLPTTPMKPQLPKPGMARRPAQQAQWGGGTRSMKGPAQGPLTSSGTGYRPRPTPPPLGSASGGRLGSRLGTPGDRNAMKPGLGWGRGGRWGGRGLGDANGRPNMGIPGGAGSLRPGRPGFAPGEPTPGGGGWDGGRMPTIPGRGGSPPSGPIYGGGNKPGPIASMPSKPGSRPSYPRNGGGIGDFGGGKQPRPLRPVGQGGIGQPGGMIRPTKSPVSSGQLVHTPRNTSPAAVKKALAAGRIAT